MQFPVEKNIIDAALKQYDIKYVSRTSIRELVAVIKYIEKEAGIRFIRMDMGVPGLPSPRVGIEAEIEALQRYKSGEYAEIEGFAGLKKEASRFVKNFLDVEVSERSCISTAGAIMGSMAAFLIASKRNSKRNGVLFFDPGFPVQKKQALALDLPVFSMEVFNFRGEKLRDELERICSENPVSMILYSNPNNPTWTSLTPMELQIIGEIANKYDIIIIEDLAYFGMDFRQNYGIPGQPPFQPTVAKYTNNYFMLISSSKAFNYAGQRVGIMVVSDELYQREYPELEARGYNPRLGPALFIDGITMFSAGVGHTAQYGLAAILKAANNGEFEFLEPLKVYEERARTMKNIFSKYGFKLAYDRDGDIPLADGFYFTVKKEGLDTETICRKFLEYGLGSISLTICGSTLTDGVRICTSQIKEGDFEELENRLQLMESQLPN
jgi:aspartate/methionine/tyrosine aminotransferase